MKPSQHSLFTIKSTALFIVLLLCMSGCLAPDPDRALKNTYWSLLQLYGEDASHIPGQPEVHLVFHLNDNTLHGSDGCNRIQGQYKKNAQNILFENLISTRMYCSAGMEQATLFLQALGKTEHMKIEEDTLILYGSNMELARFLAKEEY